MLEVGALLELTKLVVTEAEELPPEPNKPEVPPPKAEIEEPPEVNTGIAGPLLEKTGLVEEEDEELKPKLIGAVLVLELTADPSETAVGLAPNLNKLEVGPPAETREVVSEEDVDEELRPKEGILGVGNEPNEAPVFELRAGADADETGSTGLPSVIVLAPNMGDLVAPAMIEL